MKTSGFNFTTQDSMQDIANQFKQFANSMQGGAAKLAGGLRRALGKMSDAQGVEFFTPKGNDPFDALNTDPPGFAVGVTIPKFIGTGGGNIVLQLYLWDRGSHREGRVVTPYSSGAASASRNALDQLAQALTQAGSTVQN
jgi:hypothetical protein